MAVMSGNPEGSPAAVLVVDDDRSTRLLLKKVLGHSGLAVDLAENGAEAMELLRARSYGAILLDLVMPQPDGFAVLRHLESTAPDLLRKVIIITGYPQQAAGARVCATLSKPLDIATLLSLTHTCLQDL